MSRRNCARRGPSDSDQLIRRAAALEGLELRRLLSASSLDTSFNGTGVLVDVVAGTDFGGAAVVQPWDDKIVVLKNGSGGPELVRYNANGTFDAAIPLTNFDFAVDVAIAPGNQLVVAGDSSTVLGDVQVARFSSALAPAGLSSNYSVGLTTNDIATGVEVRADGSIVLGGQTDTDMFVMQLDSSGNVMSTTPINFGFGTTAGGIAVNPSTGAVVIVGDYNDNSSQNFAAARVDTAGNLDLTFDGDGKLLVSDLGSNDTETLTSVVVSSSGDVYAVGKSAGAGALIHITSSGGYDATFGGSGVVNVLGAESGAFSVALAAGGKLLITGAPVAPVFSLSRYTTSGAADTTFDGDGNVQTVIGTSAIGPGLAQHADGRIVVAGTADNDLAVARYGDAPGGPNPSPTALAITRTDDAVRTLGVTFTGSFTDPGDTHQVKWEFDDGNVIAFHPSTDAGALTPTHAYSTTGTYLVKFTVKDSGGNEVSTTHQVVVKEAGIIAGQLFVVGAGGNDNITLKDNVGGIFKVRIGGVIVGQYNQNAISKIVITGGNGADDIAIERDVTLPSEIYGGEGDDVIKGGGGNDVMFGEGGDDKLKARDAHDIVVGGAGSDTLAGGDGRDLLFGGAGADKIAGQDDSDIILSGTTSYDTPSPSNLAALEAIHTEWRRTDLTTTQRINSIKVTGVGPGNAYKLLGGTTVFDDAARDTLTSGSGGDWFLANPGGTSVLDKITDLNSVDFIDSITFILAP